MLKYAIPGAKVKYIGDAQGELKQGAVVTIKSVEISFGTRVQKWFTTVRTEEKNELGEEMVLFLEMVVPV